MAVVEETVRHTAYKQLESPTAKLVYCSLSEHGGTTARQLSQRLDESLLTVYGVLETLCERGVVSREQSDGPPVYTASTA